MPLLSTVIDDKSPLISYDPTWVPGSAQDQFATDYYLGTFAVNNVTGGSATLNFNGTAIWIYGANRPNHGSYSVQLDSATYSNYNGAGNNLFQRPLFNTSFSQGMHTARLTNTASGNLYVDIDMIVWQSMVGNADDQLVVEMVQNTDPRFKYQEPAWDTTSNTIDFNLFSNGTGHITETSEASVTFTFTLHRYTTLTGLPGEAVTVFGTSGLYSGLYSAQLDGGNSVEYNASNSYRINYETVIYHADNLGPGSHQLVLINLPDAPGQSLSVDYAQLWTIANATSGGTPESGLGDSTSSTSQIHLGPGAMVGIVVAAVLAVLGVGAAILFYRRWKAALATQHDLYRTYVLQRRPPDSVIAPPTGFSSSLETRSNASLLRNDTSVQPLTGRAQQPTNNLATQRDRPVPISPLHGLRDSRSITDAVSSPTQSLVDGVSGRRPLPEAPDGGLSLSAGFPKLAGSQRNQRTMTVDRSSIAVSEVPPPNYTQATRNAAAALP